MSSGEQAPGPGCSRPPEGAAAGQIDEVDRPGMNGIRTGPLPTISPSASTGQSSGTVTVTPRRPSPVDRRVAEVVAPDHPRHHVEGPPLGAREDLDVDDAVLERRLGGDVEAAAEELAVGHHHRDRPLLDATPPRSTTTGARPKVARLSQNAAVYRSDPSRAGSRAARCADRATNPTLAALRNHRDPNDPSIRPTSTR